MPETYLFDLDDTIIDSSIYSKMHHELLAEIVRRLKMTESDLHGHITRLKQSTGKEKPDTFELCKDLKCVDIYYEILEKYVRHTYCLKNREIPSIFKKLKDGKKKIGVVSNSQERTIRLFLDTLNLSQFVDFIESGRKDSVLFWVQLEKRHNFFTGETLVLDDSPEVLAIAQEAGYQVMDAKRIKDI